MVHRKPLNLHTGSSEGIVDTSQLHTVKELVRRTKETCQSISTEHKDIHASISKFGKAIDKVRTFIRTLYILCSNSYIRVVHHRVVILISMLQSHCTVLYTMHTAPPYTTPPPPQSLQADISGLGVEGVLSDKSHSRELDAAICEHLFRQGRLDIGEMIIEVGSQGEGLSSLRSHDVIISCYMYVDH